MDTIYKTMVNEGWDISENKMLNRLNILAKEGWILESMSVMKFKLTKGEAQDIIYAMDYQPQIDDMEEYLRIFKEAGWTLVCESVGYHIFSAPNGTKPIYTDKTYLTEARNNRKKIAAILVMVGTVGLFLGIWLTNYLGGGIGSLFAEAFTIIMAGLFGFNITWLFGLLFRRDK